MEHIELQHLRGYHMHRRNFSHLTDRAHFSEADLVWVHEKQWKEETNIHLLKLASHLESFYIFQQF